MYGESSGSRHRSTRLRIRANARFEQGLENVRPRSMPRTTRRRTTACASLRALPVPADHDGLAHCRGRQTALASARIRRSRAAQRSPGLAARRVRRHAPGTAHLNPVAARTVAPPGRSLQPSGRCSGWRVLWIRPYGVLGRRGGGG